MIIELCLLAVAYSKDPPNRERRLPAVEWSDSYDSDVFWKDSKILPKTKQTKKRSILLSFRGKQQSCFTARPQEKPECSNTHSVLISPP